MSADRVTVIEPGAGEVIADAPDRTVRLLADDAELHATWSRFGAGRDGADLHIHRDHTDFFYVLEGELTVRLGPEGDPHTVAPGELASIPPFVVHGFRNASDAEVEYLNFHAPGSGFADYMRGRRDGTSVAYDQHDPPADGGLPAGLAEIGQGEAIIDEPGLRVRRLTAGDAIEITETEIDGEWSSSGPALRERRTWWWIVAGQAELGDERLDPGTWLATPGGVPRPEPIAGAASTILTLA